MGTLDELSEAISTAGGVAAPSVVRIGRNLRGCGVVVADGVIVTSAHNLRGRETTVTLPDGQRVTARVAGADVDGDLAVLRADTTGTHAIEWAGGEITPGRPVIAVGGGHGDDTTATLGFVSGTDHSFRGPRGRRISGAVEHTAPLPRGSSGGPVVDPRGRLVGINTHRVGDGFYLAVPADERLRGRVDALAEGKEPIRFRLGVGLAPADIANRLRRQVGLSEEPRLLVRGVVEDGPADRAAVTTGDLIVAAGGQPTPTVDDLGDALAQVDPDSPRLELKLLRGADEMTVEVHFEPGAAAGEQSDSSSQSEPSSGSGGDPEDGAEAKDGS